MNITILFNSLAVFCTAAVFGVFAMTFIIAHSMHRTEERIECLSRALAEDKPAHCTQPDRIERLARWLAL